jgi:hypothetical protein
LPAPLPPLLRIEVEEAFLEFVLPIDLVFLVPLHLPFKLLILFSSLSALLALALSSLFLLA